MRRIDAIVETIFDIHQNKRLRTQQAIFKNKDGEDVAAVNSSGGIRVYNEHIKSVDVEAFRDWLNTLLGED